MTEVTATEFNRKPGAIGDSAMIEPVQIIKNGRPKLILMSYEHYKAIEESLEELEDFYWAMKADEAKKDAEWMSPEETLAFLESK